MEQQGKGCIKAPEPERKTGDKECNKKHGTKK